MSAFSSAGDFGLPSTTRYKVLNVNSNTKHLQYSILLMEEILHQWIIWRIYHYFRGFIHFRWFFRISKNHYSSLAAAKVPSSQANAKSTLHSPWRGLTSHYCPLFVSEVSKDIPQTSAAKQAETWETQDSVPRNFEHIQYIWTYCATASLWMAPLKSIESQLTVQLIKELWAENTRTRWTRNQQAGLLCHQGQILLLSFSCSIRRLLSA